MLAQIHGNEKSQNNDQQISPLISDLFLNPSLAKIIYDSTCMWKHSFIKGSLIIKEALLSEH